MKPTNSEIITPPKPASLPTGMQHGERGLATRENTHIATAPQGSQDALATALERLTHSLRLPLVTDQARNDLADQAARLAVPAKPEWLAARIASLLSPYYEKDTPQAVREMEAEDWVISLTGRPRWAVDAAVRWWKGPDNPMRHRRPFEGDIVARVIVEMGAVRAAQVKISAFDAGVTIPARLPEPERKPMTAEQAAAIMAEVGFKPKTFGAETI